MKKFAIILAAILLCLTAGCSRPAHRVENPNPFGIHLPIRDVVIWNRAECRPKDYSRTRSNITSWLKKATVSHAEIPKSQDDKSSSGFMWPPSLDLCTSDQFHISVCPAWYVVRVADGWYQTNYVKNVLILKVGDTTTKIQSEKLYDWLMSKHLRDECVPYH